MGICDSIEKNQNIAISSEPPDILKEKPNINPISRNEIKELFSYESALCKIRVEEEILIGTGFFCEINDDNIPFKKALFTNNHVLNESYIKNNKIIELEYLKEKKKIEITKNRKKFTSEIYDYTCIEIFDTDKIKKFFEIDKSIIENKNSVKNMEIFILQYSHGGELFYSNGIITDIENEIIEHTANTLYGSSGSPLIRRYNNKFILGIHFGADLEKTKNLATPFDIIIKDIGEQDAKLSGKNIEESFQFIRPKNIINILYQKEEGEYGNYIFGKKFVENNKDNIQLVIDNKKLPLIEEYALKEGKNTIQMIILNKLTNLEYMFFGCKSLVNIDDLKYLDVSNVDNFSYIFYNCSISDIKALEYWDVSRGQNFELLFSSCESLSNLSSLKKWDVSKGKNFQDMFHGCSLLTDLQGLDYWDVSNGNNFSKMFSECKSLSNIEALKYWNVSNGNDFSEMFHKCSSLLNLKVLENWDVSNGKGFSGMFAECSSLSNLKGLENWDVSNGIVFAEMFAGCESLSNVYALENWNVSNGSDFFGLFRDCTSLMDYSSVVFWNFADKRDIDRIFI